VGYAFVDDTDICQSGQDEFTAGEEVATQMQGTMYAWEGGMRAARGAIVPEKAFGAMRRRRNLQLQSSFGT
jgi:hypothetical protein